MTRQERIDYAKAQRSHYRQSLKSTEVLVIHCPDCSTTEQGGFSSDDLRAGGFVLNEADGVWEKPCATCAAKRTAANAEYEALAAAAMEIGRMYNTGPLTTITIPSYFDREGEKVFGFWTLARSRADGPLETFVRSARLIVESVNEDHGVQLAISISRSRTQAIVHGTVD